jgi:hypothetical protein
VEEEFSEVQLLLVSHGQRRRFILPLAWLKGAANQACCIFCAGNNLQVAPEEDTLIRGNSGKWKGAMSDWIPLFQSLIWPAFLTALLFYGRTQVKTIMDQIAARIKAGASLQVGPSGLALGQTENKLTRLDETVHAPDSDAPDDRRANQRVDDTVADADLPGGAVAQYAKVTYLIHAVSGPQIDTAGVERRVIHIIVGADSPEILNEVERVVYHLHPTFPDPDREVTDRHNNFELTLAAWGEFNLWADVYFRNNKKPLILFRYVNF